MAKASLIRKALAVAVSGMLLALFLGSSGRSMEAGDMSRIAALLKQLSADLGPFTYDEEEADRIFEEDEAHNGRIEAAGLSRDQWRAGVDAAFRGYLATIPAAVISARLNEVLEKLDRLSGLSDEQKAEIRDVTREKIAEINLLRAEGEAYADAVRPYAGAIEAAFQTGLAADAE